MFPVAATPRLTGEHPGKTGQPVHCRGRHGVAIEQDYRGTMKRRLQRANKLNARAVLIIGDDELAKGVAQLKDLDSGAQREVALDALADTLKACPSGR